MNAFIERGQGTSLTICRKLVEFYYRTPVVKFVSHIVSNVILTEYCVYLMVAHGHLIHTIEEVINLCNVIQLYFIVFDEIVKDKNVIATLFKLN